MNTVRHLFNRSKRFGISKTEKSKGQFLLCCIYNIEVTIHTAVISSLNFLANTCTTYVNFFMDGWKKSVTWHHHPCNSALNSFKNAIFPSGGPITTMHRMDLAPKICISANNDALWNYVRALYACICLVE